MTEPTGGVMREIITDMLDTTALLLIAAGLGCQATGWANAAMVGSFGLNAVAVGAGLFVSGMIVLGGSYYAARRGEARS